MKVYEETAEDHDIFFGNGEFTATGGNMMSLTFYIAACNRLQQLDTFRKLMEFKLTDEGGKRLTYSSIPIIHDYGCAEGDGSAVLQVFFPMAHITGFDMSSVAVQRARDRWPHIDFEVCYIEDASQVADIIYTSHTLEHMEDPVAAIERLLKLCQILVVIVPPLTAEYDGGHKGAVPTREWIDKLDKKCKKATVEYNTLRKNYGKPDKIALPEGNIMLILQGGK